MGGSGSDKTNVLLNLIKHQRSDVDKIHLYVKELLETKYQLVFNRGEKLEVNSPKKGKEFIDYSQAIDDVYENLVFHDMIVDMEAIKNQTNSF